jgi:non-heme chloroperoxidase
MPNRMVAVGAARAGRRNETMYDRADARPLLRPSAAPAARPPVSYLTTPDGVRLRVCDRGQGPAIVLVHGWKMSHRIWDRTVAALEDRFRVVAFDLRGMGESDKPNGRYDFDELSDDLGHVLRALELDDVTLVGWSMGCSVSLEYLRRDGSRVGRLVLVNGPLRLARTDDFPWTMTQAELDGYVGAIAKRWPEDEYAFTQATFVEPVPHVVDWIYSIALQTPLDVVLKTVRAQARLDHRDLLAVLELPVLAIYCTGDPYYPTELAAYVAERAPRGRALVLERSGHFPFLEADAERFNEAIAAFAENGEA